MAGRNLFPDLVGDQQEDPIGINLFADSPPPSDVVEPVKQEPIKAEELSEGSALDVILEPAQAVASSLAGTIAGGIAGAVAAPFVGAEEAGEIITGTQEAAAEFGRPETQRGQAALETLGDVMEAGIDIARFPISGLAGLADLISGQTAEQAAKTISDVQEKGIGKTAGDQTFEATGDPLLSAAATIFPEVLGSVFPLAKIVRTQSALKAKLADKVKASSAQPELGGRLRLISEKVKAGEIDQNTIRELSRLESIAREKSGQTIADKIAKISNDISKGDTSAASKLGKVAEDVAESVPEKSLVKYIVDGSGKVKTDRLAQETIKQGFDQGVVAAVKGATKIDRSKMAKMTNIMEKGKENALFAMKNRPSDVAGDSLLDRVRFVKETNRTAGKELDVVAKSLKGQSVNFDNPVNNFLNNLDEMGVKLDKRFRPNFKGSDVEGLAAPQNAIANIVKRLSSGRRGVAPDAHELHRMKRFIDEVVTYGKQGEGLSGKTERILKQLRRDLDSTLDDAFPEYNRVNTTYADTVGSLDALQDVAGKKMDLFGKNADKATGTLLRRLMSNAQSRVNLVDAVDNLESVARKYGGDFADDISTQMLFADELDNVFGSVARTSFAGETAKGIRKGAEVATGQRTVVGAALEAGAAGVEKLRGINEKNAFKSMNDLLRRE